MKILNSSRNIFLMMLFICSILVGTVLKIASTVILPFTIAILLSIVMYPIVKFLTKRKVPYLVSVVLVIIIFAAVLFVLGFALFSSGSNILAVYPKYENRMIEIYIWIARLFELPFDESLSLWDNIWGQLGIRTWGSSFAVSFSEDFFSFFSDSFLVIIFFVFIMLEAGFFKEKLEVAFEERSEQINRIGQDLMTQVMRYLTAKFFISLANGLIFAVAFYFIGLEFAVLWGVIQFFLNFIPNLGSIVAGVCISLFALIQFWPEPSPIIMVVAVILVVNLILCNIFDPKIIGDHVAISPLMVLVSLVLWGWIWGFAGMVLSVPMTVIIKIVCENVTVLKPISILIGTQKSVNSIRAKA